LLDRVLIEFVDDPVDRCPVEPRVVGPQRALRPRVGDLLDADDDVHDRPASCRCPLSARPGVPGWVKTAKRGRPVTMRGARAGRPWLCYLLVASRSNPRSAASTTLASSIALVIGPT